MKRPLSSALILGLLLFPAVGLVGCGQQSKTSRTKTITTPGGTTTTSTETKVESTGDKREHRAGLLQQSHGSAGEREENRLVELSNELKP